MFIYLCYILYKVFDHGLYMYMFLIILYVIYFLTISALVLGEKQLASTLWGSTCVFQGCPDIQQNSDVKCRIGVQVVKKN